MVFMTIIHDAVNNDPVARHRGLNAYRRASCAESSHHWRPPRAPLIQVDAQHSHPFQTVGPARSRPSASLGPPSVASPLRVRLRLLGLGFLLLIARCSSPSTIALSCRARLSRKPQAPVIYPGVGEVCFLPFPSSSPVHVACRHLLFLLTWYFAVDATPAGVLDRTRRLGVPA